MDLDIKQIFSVFLILFAIIDIVGNIPVIIGLKNKGVKVDALKVTVASAILMTGFLFVGESILTLFGVDVESFAIAGGIILFIVGLEMVLSISIFKMGEVDEGSSSIVPVAFPLIAGSGTLTTILSLRAEFETINILVGIFVNLIFVYVVIRSSDFIQKKLGSHGAGILRKVFGVILLSISIKLIKSNWKPL